MAPLYNSTGQVNNGIGGFTNVIPQPRTYSGVGLSSLDLPSTGNMSWAGYSNNTPELSFLDKTENYFKNDFLKPTTETVRTVNPDGTISMKTIDGGLLSSDAAKVGQGLYSIGMDGFNIYNTNKNYNLQRNRFNLMKKEANANYGLSAKKFNNAIADKNAAREAARASGFRVRDVHYDTAATTL